MDKVQFLGVANSVRMERLSRDRGSKPRHAFFPEHSAKERFADLAKDLGAGEREQLLRSLTASLEKERRRCKGRRQNYDPGRHIGLYIAIKALTSDAKSPRNDPGARACSHMQK